MNISINNEESFRFILNVTSAKELDSFIYDIEKTNLVKWRPVGDLDNNEGTIDAAIDPGDAIFERITNSIDSLIELKIVENEPTQLPENPKEAIKDIFNLNMKEFSKFDSKIQREIGRSIILKIEESDDASRPTLSIIDKGIGQKPEEFPTTFLSLHGENKINKFYLMGQYGQGGSTSFSFAKYTIFISKRYENDDIGWTIVRCIDPGPNYKRYTYQYLTTKNDEIPSINKNDLTQFSFEQHGSIVRMIRYAIPKYANQIFLRWYHLCRNSLFDTLLPFILYDKRSKDKSGTEDRYIRRTRVIYGLKNSLCFDRRKQIRHYKEIEVPVSNKRDSFTIVRYWIFNTDVTSSNYLDLSNSPVVFTLNGQRQYREGRSFIYDYLNLKILQRRIVIQIDCDGLKPFHRKNFFSTTRSMIKDTDVKTIIFHKIKDSIQMDSEIIRIMEEIRLEVLSYSDEEKRNDDKKSVSNLLKKWETLPRISKSGRIGDFYDYGTETDEEISIPKEIKDIPSYLKCVNRINPIQAEKGRRFIIKFETDAKEDYFTKEGNPGKIFTDKLPRFFQVQSFQKTITNGCFHIILKTQGSIKLGDKFTLNFHLSRHKMKDLSEKVNIIIVKMRDRRPYRGKGKDKTSQPVELPIEIIRISSNTELKTFEEKANISIKGKPAITQNNEGILIVYVNLSYKEYKGAVESIEVSSDTIEKRIDSYVCNIAAHSISQSIEYDKISEENEEEKISVEIREKIKQKEIKRVASTIIPLIIKSKL